MSIREIKVDTNSWHPGENLSQKGGEYTHVTISYDISGKRDKIDSHIASVIKNSHDLKKIEFVNTTIYWQSRFGDNGDDDSELNIKVKNKLKEKLMEIFINKQDMSREIVIAYCMVGNIRAFAFEIDA